MQDTRSTTITDAEEPRDLMFLTIVLLLFALFASILTLSLATNERLRDNAFGGLMVSGTLFIVMMISYAAKGRIKVIVPALIFLFGVGAVYAFVMDKAF